MLTKNGCLVISQCDDQWPGDVRSQCISKHSSHSIVHNMSHTAWKELTNIYGSTWSWSVFRKHKTYLLFLSFLVGNKSFILRSQYRDCCWPGDARSQVSNSHSIVINFQEYSGTAWKGLTNISRQSSCWTVFGKHKKVFTFPIISGHWDRAGIWNPSPWKSMTCLSYVVNTMTTWRRKEPGHQQ